MSRRSSTEESWAQTGPLGAGRASPPTRWPLLHTLKQAVNKERVCVLRGGPRPPGRGLPEGSLALHSPYAGSGPPKAGPLGLPPACSCPKVPGNPALCQPQTSHPSETSPWADSRAGSDPPSGQLLARVSAGAQPWHWLGVWPRLPCKNSNSAPKFPLRLKHPHGLGTRGHPWEGAASGPPGLSPLMPILNPSPAGLPGPERRLSH